jgi:hypothetical protein
MIPSASVRGLKILVTFYKNYNHIPAKESFSDIRFNKKITVKLLSLDTATEVSSMKQMPQ